MKISVKLLMICCLGILLAGCSQTSVVPPTVPNITVQITSTALPAFSQTRAVPTITSVITEQITNTSLPATPQPILVTKTAPHSTPTPEIKETETSTVAKPTRTPQPTNTVKPFLPLNPAAIPGEILFSVYPKGDIGLIKANGSDMEILLEAPHNLEIYDDRHAQWLPDGQHFSYTVDDFAQVKIWVAQTKAGEGHFLLGDVATNSVHTWSPDGQSIAYVSTHDQIIIYNLVTRTTFQLTDDYFRIASDPAWAPDGTRIAFSGIPKQGNQDIYLINTGGTNLRRVTNHDDVDQAPSWSPDSTRIAFSSTRDGDHVNDIFVMDVSQGTEEEGNIPQQLTFDDTLDIDPDWSPDGQYLVYAAHTFGAAHAKLFIIDISGERRFQLIKENTYHSPQWRP